MAKGDEYTAYAEQQSFSETNVRLRDLEERQRILKDRILLVGESVVSQREKTFSDIQALKKSTLELQQENTRLKELLQRITEFLSSTARKSDLDLLQRQFDLFRK